MIAGCQCSLRIAGGQIRDPNSALRNFNLSSHGGCGSFAAFPKLEFKVMAYAIIRSGGKQYRVSPGEVIVVEKLDADSGTKVTFSDVLFLADGNAVTTGDPVIAGANVRGEVIGQFKDKKVVAFKYKRRKGYHRTVGHRRQLTRVKIESIE
jgi:large subunit ribosomal protein L21